MSTEYKLPPNKLNYVRFSLSQLVDNHAFYLFGVNRFGNKPPCIKISNKGVNVIAKKCCYEKVIVIEL